MRIILITEQALRKAVPNARQRAKLRAGAMFKANVTTLSALIKQLFGGVDLSGMDFSTLKTEREPVFPNVDSSAENLKRIYPEIISRGITEQSLYAGKITRKNCCDVTWLGYHVILNPTKIKLSEFDAVDIGDLAYIAQFSPPPFNHKAQEILNSLKLEYYARTENNSEVN